MILQLSLRPTLHRSPATSDRGLVFREKVLFLETLNINPSKAFLLNPAIRSAPLSTLKSATRSLSSLGLPRAAVARILDMHPLLLTCDPYTHLYPLLDFLLHEVPIPYDHVHLSLTRCPRLLVSSVDHQLRPTLHFLRKLGFHGPHHPLTCHNTLLLVSSVQDTLLPKIQFLKGLGLSHAQVANMVVRSPALLTYSVHNNLRPKVEFFFKEMNGDVADLTRFPQYFSFSLERRIRPRYEKLRQLGLSFRLEDMLKVSDGEFNARLVEFRFRTLEEGQRF
ncbi:transcription termination factor MTEF1, chloroplastic [Cajanus cajan]|uniref:mTERF domain-containing protein 1, mitochondrial n=1 Tax=Cajanus cajan TaxID=3821 RepID=A0A151RS95_CAJCA|nr:transcription termination factor MTEF1, chloroplastic [Cajanus cajan]KYP45417.1 hypothetical protein KK1_033050 [Cajanus cajan]